MLEMSNTRLTRPFTNSLSMMKTPYSTIVVTQSIAVPILAKVWNSPP